MSDVSGGRKPSLLTGKHASFLINNGARDFPLTLTCFLSLGAALRPGGLFAFSGGVQPDPDASSDSEDDQDDYEGCKSPSPLIRTTIRCTRLTFPSDHVPTAVPSPARSPSPPPHEIIQLEPKRTHKKKNASKTATTTNTTNKVPQKRAKYNIHRSIVSLRKPDLVALAVAWSLISAGTTASGKGRRQYDKAELQKLLIDANKGRDKLPLALDGEEFPRQPPVIEPKEMTPAEIDALAAELAGAEFDEDIENEVSLVCARSVRLTPVG